MQPLRVILLTRVLSRVVLHNRSWPANLMTRLNGIVVMGTTIIERFRARMVVNSVSIVSRYDFFFILLFDTRETFKMINKIHEISSYRRELGNKGGGD